METKPKKCKGSGLALGYGCGKLSTHRIYGLGVSCCYPEWLYNSEEGKKKVERCRLKAKKGIEKEVKVLTQKQKIENKSIELLKFEAKAPFQKLIRIRDHGKTCICCDRKLPFNIGEFDAGHFKNAKTYSGIILHPDNCHGQMVYCNQHLHGNESSYAEGLKKRIGVERYNTLIELSIKLKDYEWNRHDLIELKKYYNQQLRMVESGELSINDVDWSVGIPTAIQT